MDVVYKAKEYAEGKVTEALSQVVTDAYMAGYNAGYQDGYNKVVKDSVSEGTEYVDLGLSSGTLWTSNYAKDENGNVVFLTQKEGMTYNLPTTEQWQELINECKWEQKSEKEWTAGGFYHWNDWAICLGPNGNKITFEKTGLYEATDCRSRKNEILFWLKAEEYFQRNCANVILNDLQLDSKNVFSGYRLPVRLVKTIE